MVLRALNYPASPEAEAAPGHLRRRGTLKQCIMGVTLAPQPGGKTAWCCQEQRAPRNCPCSEPPLGTAESVRGDLIALRFLPCWYPTDSQPPHRVSASPPTVSLEGDRDRALTLYWATTRKKKKDIFFSSEILMGLDIRANYIAIN